MDVHSTISNNPISLSAFEAQVLGPIQMAIWEIMGTKPYLPNTTTQEADDLNKLTANFVSDAETMYTGYSYSNVQVFILGGTSKCSGQDFISVSTLTPTPEPGTMVLFGAGALLMGLGCVRKRLARRPR